MKEYQGWKIPDMDHNGIRDILNEWNKKSQPVLNLVPRRRVAIQAGGNVGVFPAGLAQHFHTVYTFEPVEFNYECMIHNLQKYQNIHSRHAGLSDKPGYAEITHITDQNCGAIRLGDTDQGLELVTIDGLELQAVDLMWLDLEGYEHKALRGATATIARCRPVLVLENNGLIHEYPADNSGSAEFRNTLMAEFGYKHVSRMMRDDVFVPVEK